MKRAFTLAELLMAVLVISIIMVALAPVITRRAYDNVSIEVNKKKGLEIFTNPGTYTFDIPVGINTLFLQGSGGGGGGAGATYIDKQVSFTSNAIWTIPSGVNQITFTITGSGGGGGAGNGKANASVNKNPAVYNNKCLGDEFFAVRGASTEEDLCITKTNITYSVIALNERCSSINCCWEADKGGGYCAPPRSGSAASGCGRPVCMYNGATASCAYHRDQGIREYQGTYRLPNVDEGKKILKYLNEWSINAGSNGLQLCSFWDNYNCPDEPLSVPRCQAHGGCIGMEAGHCSSHTIWLQGGGRFDWGGSCRRYTVDSSSNHAAGARCVRPLSRYTRFSGAGGASGAQLERTVSVLPNDTLTISIGAGGAGGVYNSNSGRGAQGGTTEIVHRRNGNLLGKYYVKGGLGGFGATVSSHGVSYTNGSAGNHSTPSGSCYANGNIGCTTLSYSGNAGSANTGGNGGRVKNSGTINLGSPSSGGYLYIDNARSANQRNTTTEANYAKGQSANVAGFGGGGGLTPAWAASASNFYGGGKGANGKVDISYRVALPGGGAGSGTRVGGTNAENKAYEIKYKVKEGDRIVFKIGAGGSGGVSNQDGINGEATVIGDNEIILLGGEGGKISTASQKNSLIAGSGGRSSYIDENNALYTNSLGIKVKGNNVSYTFNPPSNTFKGENGFSGQLKNSSGVLLNYGFDGGLGASPFGIPANLINQARTCSGGTKGENNLSAPCPNNNENANRALVHDPVNNQFGGSGGGGGGVVKDSFNLGAGGPGSSGYLRIRWDESEQD